MAEGMMRAWMTAAAVVMMTVGVAQAEAQTPPAPRYVVDAAWPKQLPNNWIMGQVGGLAVDALDHVWVNQRPRSLTDDEKGATLNPPESKCCAPAPPVMEFDAEGNLIQAWGGPGADYDWPEVEHGIFIDAKGFVWVAGNGPKDGQILKFTRDGRFVKQIGHPAAPDNSDTTHLGRPADIWVDDAANEIYVADGYGNHRVIVFDSETGAYKRHWGAYGKPPSNAKVEAVSGPPLQFANPVHCVQLAPDGLLYVCDRTNNRIQIFRKDGSFVDEWFYEPATRRAGSTWDLAMAPDGTRSLLFSADGTNNEIRILDRKTGKVLGAFGRNGRNAGEFHWVHQIAIDSKWNLYTGEVDTGKRIQKFRRADRR
jgi:DNA-binding beta-propeller fold protein YncE